MPLTTNSDIASGGKTKKGTWGWGALSYNIHYSLWQSLSKQGEGNGSLERGQPPFPPFTVCNAGNSLPSKSSKLAPPPVLTWLTLSSVPHFAAHVAVSPPPAKEMFTFIKGHVHVQLE